MHEQIVEMKKLNKFTTLARVSFLKQNMDFNEFVAMHSYCTLLLEKIQFRNYIESEFFKKV